MPFQITTFLLTLNFYGIADKSRVVHAFAELVCRSQEVDLHTDALLYRKVAGSSATVFICI